MNFSRPPHRPIREPVLPMINVVFLLLIFFLMTAKIESSDPFDLTLPQGQATEEAKADMTLFLSPEGEVAMAGLTGDAVWQALAEVPEGQGLRIEADAAMQAIELTRIIARVTRLGITKIAIGAVRQ